MTLYVPGTGETSLPKVIMSLQQIGPRLETAETNVATNTTNIATNTTNISALQTKTNGYEAAWTAYSPTLSAGTGTFTSATATARYKQIGKTIIVRAEIAITTNGSAASFIQITLPVAAISATGNQTAYGRENASGKSVNGVISAGASVAQFQSYDGTYPGFSAAQIDVVAMYESA